MIGAGAPLHFHNRLPCEMYYRAKKDEAFRLDSELAPEEV